MKVKSLSMCLFLEVGTLSGGQDKTLTVVALSLKS